MTRPLWKGRISFGLVPIPVSLYSGEKPSGLHFRLIDSRNHARIRYERVNEETGEEVPWNQTTKAYEYEDGDYIILSDEELENLGVEGTKSIDIESFVPLEDINCVYFEKPYILEPEELGERTYVLLRDSLRETKMAGIAKVVIRARQYLGAVIPYKNAILLNILRFEKELEDIHDFELPAETANELKISEHEIGMAKTLIRTMAAKWEPEQYRDEYREALMSYIDQKHRKKVAAKRREKVASQRAADVIDIASLLKKSLQEREKEPPRLLKKK